MAVNKGNGLAAETELGSQCEKILGNQLLSIASPV